MQQYIYILLGILCIVVMGVLFLFGGARPFSRGGGEALAVVDGPAPEVDRLAAGSPAAVPQETGATPRYVRVDVVGAVYNPGVYTLPADALVIDAVTMAGGYTAEAERRGFNGAAPLQDGMQIIVPTVEEFEAAGGVPFAFGAAGAAAAVDDGLICLNAATYSQLRTLPQIGTTRANSILAHRDSIDAFTHVEQLLDISGIGSGILNAIRPYITVR